MEAVVEKSPPKDNLEFITTLRNREEEVRILQQERHGINSLDYKPYHGSDHIDRVANRNVLIMQTYFDSLGEPASEDEAREREEKLVFAHYLGIVHDTVQNYDMVRVSDGTVIEGDWKDLIGKEEIKRKRKVRENEIDSINEELEFMNQFPDIFSEKHKEWLTRALMATIPGWNGATVYQPELKDDDSVLTLSTASADLKGGIFMDGAEQFLREGDLNLLEDYPDILEVALNTDKYSQKEIDAMGERIRIWRGNQAPFATAQWEQLQSQASRFGKAEGNLREGVFKANTFKDTYKQIVERAEKDKKTKAVDLLSELRERVNTEQAKYPKEA